MGRVDKYDQYILCIDKEIHEMAEKGVFQTI